MGYYTDEQISRLVAEDKAIRAVKKWIRLQQYKTGYAVRNNEIIRYYQVKLGWRISPGEMKSLLGRIR